MKYPLIGLVTLIFFAACNKVDTPVSREDELRDGKWKLNVATLRYDPYSGTDTVYNLLGAMPDCKHDDYLVFKMNYIGSQNSGSSKCDGSDPDEVEFRWELYNNGDAIQFWNAEETFFGTSGFKAEFFNYTTSRFTLRDTQYVASQVNSTQTDTFTYTYTFIKF